MGIRSHQPMTNVAVSHKAHHNTYKSCKPSNIV